MVSFKDKNILFKEIELKIKGTLLLLLSVLLFVTLACDMGTGGHEGNNYNGVQFSEGWWIYIPENSVGIDPTYIKYGSKKEILRLGVERNEYDLNYNTEKKNTYDFDSLSHYSTIAFSKVSDDDLPEWAKEIYFTKGWWWYKPNTFSSYSVYILYDSDREVLRVVDRSSELDSDFLMENMFHFDRISSTSTPVTFYHVDEYDLPDWVNEDSSSGIDFSEGWWRFTTEVSGYVQSTYILYGPNKEILRVGVERTEYDYNFIEGIKDNFDFDFVSRNTTSFSTFSKISEYELPDWARW